MEIYKINFQLIIPRDRRKGTMNIVVFRSFNEIPNSFKSEVLECVLTDSYNETDNIEKTFYMIRHPTHKTSLFVVEQVSKNIFSLKMHLENVSPLKNKN